MGFFFPQFIGSDLALGYGFGLKNPAGKVMGQPPLRRRAELQGQAGNLADRPLNSEITQMPLGLSV